MDCVNLRGNTGFENKFLDLKIKSVELKIKCEI